MGVLYMRAVSQDLVDDIRKSARELVRELGFLRPTIVGTDMSASAVHAILEIGAAGALSAKALSELLLLEKSTVSRLLRGLIEKGELIETRSLSDARAKDLQLSEKGRQTFDEIAERASEQVKTAVSLLPELDQQSVRNGLAAYAASLEAARCGTREIFDQITAEIKTGYVPGLIASITRLHVDFYSQHFGFGAKFEAAVAGGMADFVPRLDQAQNQIWHVRLDNRIAGSIAIDGEDLGDGIAHLRWFFLSEELRGTGTGRALLEAALEFCAAQKFQEIHLWTFKGLDAARRLYEKKGFKLTEEYTGDQWSNDLTEQKFTRPVP